MVTETIHIMKGLSSIAVGCSGSAKVSVPESVQETADHGTQCYDFIDQVVFGQRLHLMTLEVFSNLNDSMILSTDSAIQFLATATNVVTSLVNIHHNYRQ